MKTDLEPNFDIYIPNDSLDYTFSSIFNDTVDVETYFIWSMGVHTHRWGKDYDIWVRNEDGSKGEKIFDGSNMGGEPNGVNIGFDYQHPPTKTWEYPFLGVNMKYGLIHEAVYNNKGTVPVTFGPTSDDEMMIMGVVYLSDTTGLGNFGVGIIQPEEISKDLSIYPNPFDKMAKLSFANPDNEEYVLKIYDMFGRLVMNKENITSESFIISKEGLNSGIYTLELSSKSRSLKGRFALN